MDDLKRRIYELEATVKTMNRTEFILAAAIIVNALIDVIRAIRN